MVSVGFSTLTSGYSGLQLVTARYRVVTLGSAVYSTLLSGYSGLQHVTEWLPSGYSGLQHVTEL